MAWGLNGFKEPRQLHSLTFSLFTADAPNFRSPKPRATFESSLERVRQQYGLCVYGYVVMPEHIHMLVNEPERGTRAQGFCDRVFVEGHGF
jgi:putative transposase